MDLRITLVLISFSHGLNWDVQVGDSCVKPKNNHTGIKYYILLWTFPKQRFVNVTFDKYLRELSHYHNETCIYQNCLFTINQNIMHVKHYDAVVYFGVTLTKMNPKDFPERSNNQIYIFDQYEAAEKYPLNNRMFDNFFNLTLSYKLDADRPHTYLCVYDKKGIKIGPKEKINWKTTNKELNNDLKEKIYNKTKLVAWFVSRCNAVSGRDVFVKQLKVALKEINFNQTVDIYGDCGNLNCTKNSKQCLEMLSKDYMFYLSFENSFSKDYVTEKLRNPLQYDTVPIVYGGADYERFVPPGSYINACLLGPRYLAMIMVYLYENRKLYESYFKWKHLYEYDFCRNERGHSHTKTMCEVLNEKHSARTHQNFRTWWNKESKRKCHFRSSLKP